MKGNWRRIGMIAALVALVGVVGVGTVAYAQSTDEDSGWPDFRARIHEAIAGILGISVEEYDTAVDTAQAQVLDEAVAEGWLTQEQADQMQERMEEGFSLKGMDKGFPPAGGRRGFGTESPVDVAAEVLGLSEEDLMAELHDGKSIADVAEEQGVDLQDIADAYVAKVTDNLEQAVADEKITQEQADAMLSNIEEHATEMLEKAGGARMPGGPGHGRPRGGFDRFGEGGLPAPFGDPDAEVDQSEL